MIFDILFGRFEEQWGRSQEKTAELDQLTHCYQKFKDSYQSALFELKRRIQYELEIEKQIKDFQQHLRTKHVEELKLRHKFNSAVTKYLPPSFCPVLGMNPAKYDVVCTQTAGLLAGAGETAGGKDLYAAELREKMKVQEEEEKK